MSLRPLFLLIPVAVLCAACADGPARSGTAARQDTSVRFTDVTADTGLDSFKHVTGAYGQKLFPETMGAGIAFVDFDGDDWPDVLAVGGGTWPGHGEPVQGLYLFRNNGDGTFSDVSAEAGLDGVHTYGFGLAVADYDLDGDADFFLTSVTQNRLFRNDGGRFTDTSEPAGFAGISEWSTSAAFFDADGDGYPDLYVANYVPWTPETDRFCSVDGTTKSYCTPLAYEGQPSRFYRNNADDTFTDRTDEAGFGGAAGKSLGVLPLDHDEDGWTDLMVTNDALPDLLYRNNGDGTFREIGLMAGVAFDERGRARAGMGVDAGVVDTTGRVSIFIGNFSDETLGVYRYGGNGMFEERSSASRLARPSLPTLTFGLALFDVELDGDLDLFAANGHVQDDIDAERSLASYRQPPHLFLNDGTGQFRDVVPEMPGPFGAPAVLRAAAVADYDRDGDVDLITTENGAPLRLWRNETRSESADTASPNFLQLHLLSENGGWAALGARAVVYADAREQQRFVRTAHSYLSASDPVLTFGLDDTSRIDSVVVFWPGDQRQVWRDLAPNARYRLSENVERGEMREERGEKKEE